MPNNRFLASLISRANPQKSAAGKSNAVDDAFTSSASVRDYMQSTSSIEICVSELQLGMYVSKLDCDWLETPFLVQGFVVETLDDIDLLSHYCKRVWVDQKVDHLTAPRKVAHESLLGSVRPTIHKIPPPQVLKQCGSRHRDANAAAKSLIESIRLGEALNTEQAKATVNSCVRNVMADPGATLLVAKMQERDDETASHALNVCVLAVALGQYLGLNAGELHNLGISALLHDVGKIKLSADLLQIPTAQRSEEQQRDYQEHTIHGRNILASAKNIYTGAVDVAYSHHERVDGSGYPRGLKSSGISQYSRIVAIASYYDDLVAGNDDLQAVAATSALKRLMEEREGCFDGELVNQFIKMIGLYPAGTIVELMNGCVAIVIAKNYRYQHLPRVLVVLDENKNPVTERVCDLGKTINQQLDSGYLIHSAFVDGSFGIKLSDYLEKGLIINR